MRDYYVKVRSSYIGFYRIIKRHVIIFSYYTTYLRFDNISQCAYHCDKSSINVVAVIYCDVFFSLYSKCFSVFKYFFEFYAEV